MQHKIKIAAAFLLSALVLPGLVSAADYNFESTWQTNWGEMKLKQEGLKVTGTYTHDSGKIDATVSGNSLVGKWSEYPSYKEPGDAGDVELKMSADGKSFEGSWRYGSAGGWSGGWTGTRTSGDVKLNITAADVAVQGSSNEGSSAAAPAAAQKLIYDTTSNYIGACSLTDSAAWTFDKDMQVSMVQFWYNWQAGETDLDFTIYKDGQEFIKGTAKRTGCDTYQKNWCNADYNVSKVFPAGSYTSKVSKASQCLQPGKTGTVRFYGTDTAVTGNATSQNTNEACKDGTGLYISNLTVASGRKLSVPVMACNVKNLANMDLEISYDPAMLAFESAEKGSLNSSSMFQGNSKDGKVKISFAAVSGFNGNGSIAYINFLVSGSSGNTCDLKPVVSSAKDSGAADIAIKTASGKFTVGKSAAGDCDGDGLVSARDALAALQMAVEKISADLCYDINGDGKVDSSDAREILKKAVGK
ncbi:MAG: cohesin domain-containing protein [Candidatus Paceibacterota bacterium]|jgi:hypothetical protein